MMNQNDQETGVGKSTSPFHLFLVGFMGTGKSAVGRTVAKKLGMPFLDADAAIERLAGKRIKSIFETSGEAKFREMERSFIDAGLPSESSVIACGGGLVLQPGMKELLESKGAIICLFASAKTILERTSRSQTRPLLDVENPEEAINKLLAVREPVYMQTGKGVSTENRSIIEVATNIVRIYRSELP